MYAYAVHAKSPTCAKTSSDENAWRVNALSAPDRGLRIAFITLLPPSGRGLGGRGLAVYSDGWSLAFVGHQLSELPVETHIRGTTMPKSPRRSRLICQVVRVWGHLYEVWSPTGSHPPPRCGGRDAREASWWNAGRRVDPWAYAYPGRAKSRNSRPGGYQGLQQQRRKSIGAGFGWRVGGEGVNSGCSLRLVPFCPVPYETVSMAPSWGTPDALGTFRWVGKSEFISGRPSRPAPHFPCLTQVKHQSRGANTSSFHRLQTLSTTLLVSQLERDLLR